MGRRAQHPDCECGPFLIAGLGNPGREYARNRHNVGFHCIDHLAAALSIPLTKRRFKSLFGEGRIAGYRVVLAKPLTFMNASGEAIAPLSRWYKISPGRMLVIHDDLDLPLARIRLRPGGSAGGHHGIESIIEHLDTQDFARLRIGIGRPQCGEPTDYVLDDFSREQEPLIARLLDLVDDIALCFLQHGIHAAMNEYNSQWALSNGTREVASP